MGRCDPLSSLKNWVCLIYVVRRMSAGSLTMDMLRKNYQTRVWDHFMKKSPC